MWFAALPTLDIAEGALDKLFHIYKQLLPQMGGYLTHAGELHRGRLELVLQKLAELELETLEQRAQVSHQFSPSHRGANVCTERNPPVAHHQHHNVVPGLDIAEETDRDDAEKRVAVAACHRGPEQCS